MKTKSQKKPAELVEGSGVVPDLHLATWLEGEVRYISDQCFHLVLYTNAHPSDQRPWGPSATPRFKTPSAWKSLFHQTAGYACHHKYLHARFLLPSPKIIKLGRELLRKYNGSLVSQPVSLKDANEYNSLLGKYDLNANRSYVNLEEGFYPIDIECLPKVTTEKFSKDLRTELLKPLPKYKSRKISEIFANWVDFELAILGPNCD